MPDKYEVNSPDSLHDLLIEKGLPVDEKWGKGPTKTYEQLWEEIADGETEMIAPETFEEQGEYGDIIRVTNVLGIDIFAEVDGVVYRLREDRQEYKRGGMRKRSLESSIAEKIKADEDHGQAVQRALREELGVDGLSEADVDDKGSSELWKASATYPGLPAKLKVHWYRVQLPSEVFDPNGYVEHQPDKDIFFVWDKVEPSA